MASNSQQKMIRIPSKLTDELITIDSPKRQSRIYSKSVNTAIQFRNRVSDTKQSFWSQNQSLWLQSATTNTREKSPSFKFPQAQRFSSLDQDERKNRLIVKLNLANDLAGNTGVSFAKSNRIDHFKPKKYVEDFPSPASYCSQIISTKINMRKASTAGGNRASLIKLTNNQLGSEMKGASIPKQKNPQRLFLHHGQKLPYHPHITKSNPGVGKYIINPEGELFTTKNSLIGLPLKKFNEMIPLNPGPGAYDMDGNNAVSNTRGSKFTFAKSQRTYLVEPRPENFSPSPTAYNVKRYLDK